MKPLITRQMLLIAVVIVIVATTAVAFVQAGAGQDDARIRVQPQSMMSIPF